MLVDTRRWLQADSRELRPALTSGSQTGLCFDSFEDVSRSHVTKSVPPEQEEPVSFIVLSAGALTHLHTCTSRHSKCGFHISKLVADISRAADKHVCLH